MSSPCPRSSIKQYTLSDHANEQQLIPTQLAPSAASQESSSGDSEETRRRISDDYYRSYGYLPPHEVMPRRGDFLSRNISEAPSGAQSSQASKKSKDENKPRALKASDIGFLQGLRDRNVVFQGSVDTNDSISAFILRESTSKTTEDEESNWRLDLQESQVAGEATFQRTIMMEIINRHKLGDCLKYSCESLWICQPMPKKKSENFDRMAAPKPDLAVSFRTSAVIDELRRNRLSYLTQYISPESLKEDKIDRAFHFFSMEVKNAQTSSKDNIALRQNFNVASQALHNIYMVMRLAKMEDFFFREVRFFSVTATCSGFHVRCHRAVRVDPDVWLEEDYPLGFHFEDIFSAGEGYTRAKVTGTVHNIFFEYGIKTLLPKLQEAVMAAFKALQEGTSLSSSLGKRPAEDLIDPQESFSSQRRALNDFQINTSQDSVLGQPVSA